MASVGGQKHEQSEDAGIATRVKMLSMKVDGGSKRLASTIAPCPGPCIRAPFMCGRFHLR